MFQPAKVIVQTAPVTGRHPPHDAPLNQPQKPPQCPPPPKLYIPPSSEECTYTPLLREGSVGLGPRDPLPSPPMLSPPLPARAPSRHPPPPACDPSPSPRRPRPHPYPSGCGSAARPSQALRGPRKEEDGKGRPRSSEGHAREARPGGSSVSGGMHRSGSEGGWM